MKKEDNDDKAKARWDATTTTNVFSSSVYFSFIEAKPSVRVFNDVSNVFIKLTIRLLRDIGALYRRVKIPEIRKTKEIREPNKSNVKKKNMVHTLLR